MTRNRAQLRELIRQEVGDEVRLSGTATSGSRTTIVDTSGLVQADDYWNGRKIHIQASTDGKAPQGESRKISDFSSSTHTLSLEMPLSAAVEAGDSYQIAIWPDAVYDALITAAIAAYSKYRPYRSTGVLATVCGTRYYDPPAGVDLRAGDRIEEIRYMNPSTLEDYPIEGWNPDRHQNKIDLGSYASDARTLTVFYVIPHADFADDSDTVTVPDQDEELVSKWVRAQIWLLMSRESFDEFGNLAPSRWSRGNVSEETGSGRQGMKNLHDSEMREWLEQIKGGGFILSGSEPETPGHWVAPHDYRIHLQ